MKMNWGCISIYLFCLILFPIAALQGIHKLDHKNVLLEKGDTRYLRGVAACFVMLSHYVSYIGESSTLNDAFNKPFVFIMRQLGGIGVLIFFFISGYGIYVSYADKTPSWEFLWKRIKDVYFPYLIVKGAIVLLEFMEGEIRNFDLNRFFSVLLAKEEWFIQVILLEYLSFFLIWKLLGNRKIVWYGFLIDLVLSVTFLYMEKPEGWLTAFWLFTFGMACAKYQTQIRAFFGRVGNVSTGVICIALFAGMGSLFAANKGMLWANLFKIWGGYFFAWGFAQS